MNAKTLHRQAVYSPSVKEKVNQGRDNWGDILIFGQCSHHASRAATTAERSPAHFLLLDFAPLALPPVSCLLVLVVAAAFFFATLFSGSGLGSPFSFW